MIRLTREIMERMIFFLLGTFTTAISLGLFMIPNILLISHKKRLFDMPDERKVHVHPVPRLGGLSFFPVILISLCLAMGVRFYMGFPVENLPAGQVLCEFLFLAVGSMLLYLVGVTDDLIGVGYRYKFLIQIIAASLLVLSGEWINSFGGLLGVYEIPAWIGMPFTVLIVVYITNAINLIDGIDGLASGLCCIALAFLSVIYIRNAQFIYALLALSTLGVLIPFWFYNVFGNAQRGHKLYMGDAGSLTLGYILSFLVIHLSRVDTGQAGQANPGMVIAFSSLLVPLLDVIRVVLHRLRSGKNPFLPDQNHFHHKLLRTGMGVRSVMMTILFISLFFIGMNMLLVPVINLTWILLIDLVLWGVMHASINGCVKWNKKTQDQSFYKQRIQST